MYSCDYNIRLIGIHCAFNRPLADQRLGKCNEPVLLKSTKGKHGVL
jgi:hypothetical protein